MKMTIQGAIIAAIITLATLASAQLQFTGISTTEEGAIRLAWQSESNTIYRVEYADQLVDPNLGDIVWQTLYDNYPSTARTHFGSTPATTWSEPRYLTQSTHPTASTESSMRASTAVEPLMSPSPRRQTRRHFGAITVSVAPEQLPGHHHQTVRGRPRNVGRATTERIT